MSRCLQGLQGSAYGQGAAQGAAQILQQQSALAALGPTQQAALLRRVGYTKLLGGSSIAC